MDTNMKSAKCPSPETEQEVVNGARRKVVGIAIMPLLLIGLGSRAGAADPAACFDLESLPASQQRLRRSLGFRLAGADDQQHCGTCAFFIASDGGCGKCEMLSGGIVSTANVCESWAAKS
jgi:High potential iron-sulfur protein